jgi:alkaline phosphatase D
LLVTRTSTGYPSLPPLSQNQTRTTAADTKQVSDVTWIDEKPYNGKTGEGAIGVEFATTAVSSTGFGGTIASAEEEARTYSGNPELQWNEGYYRGYYELHVRRSEVHAEFFGCPTIATRNNWELPLANFTVKAGDNHLQRPVAGGTVEAGYLARGDVVHSNVTVDTETGEWTVIGFDQMFIE